MGSKFSKSKSFALWKLWLLNGNGLEYFLQLQNFHKNKFRILQLSKFDVKVLSGAYEIFFLQLS